MGRAGAPHLQPSNGQEESVMLDFLLYLAAFLCFAASAFQAWRTRSWDVLIPLGLALWVLVPLHHAWPS